MQLTQKLVTKPTVSRFTQPWPALSNVTFPSLEKSRHRVLHSAQRRHGSDGIGHGFGTKNLEVTTAMVRPYLLVLRHDFADPKD